MESLDFFDGGRRFRMSIAFHKPDAQQDAVSHAKVRLCRGRPSYCGAESEHGRTDAVILASVPARLSFLPSCSYLYDVGVG